MLYRTNLRHAGLIRRVLLGLAGSGLALVLAACAGGGATPTLPGELGSMEVPTMPPDDFATGTSTCIDPATMAIIDQLRAPGADVPGLLAANKDALIAGLGELESSDPIVNEWRDALLTALTDEDMTAAATQVARLAANEVQLTPC